MQKLHGQAQTGQRRAQVMRHPGEHQLPLAGCLFNVFGHLVEGAVHLGHLARRIADRQPDAAAFTDLPGSEYQALERCTELTHKNPRGGGGQ